MEHGNTIEISIEEAKKIFNENPSRGNNVNVTINAVVEKNSEDEYVIKIKKIISNGTSNSSEESDEELDEEEDITASKEDDVDWWEDKWDDLTNLVGHLKVKLTDIILMPFDALQSAVNSIQTGSYSQKDKLTVWSIAMEPEDIVADANKNKYVDYTIEGENLGKVEQKIHFINARNEGLEDITTIPVIPVEFYTMAKGRIDLFDINFLSGQDNTDLHQSTSNWLILRNFVSAIMHIIIYLGASILIIKLILDGIVVVSKSLVPSEKEKKLVDMNNFFKAVIMLVSCVLIMGLCIYGTAGMLNSVNTSNANELPIRVNVGSGNEDGTDNKYSFSTNIIGYFRFLAQANRPRTSDLKIMYAVVYIVLVIINTIATLVMAVRVIVMAVLSILGPAIAVSSAFTEKGLFGMTFQNWVVNYLLISSFQLIFAITYNIVLKIAF